MATTPTSAFSFPIPGDCFKKFHENGNIVTGILDVRFETFIQKLHENGISFSIRDSLNNLTSKPAFTRKEIELNFGDSDTNSKSPFITIKRASYQCAQGKLYYKLGEKRKKKPKKTDKRRLRIQNTKKRECPATMTIFWIKRFYGFSITDDSNWRWKKKVLAELNSKLLANEHVEFEDIIYVRLNLAHNHSIVSAQLNQRVDNLVKSELRRIVYEERNTELAFVKSLLRNVLRNNNISVNRTSRSFFPNNRTIRNYISKFSYQRKKSKIDLEAVSLKLDEWALKGRVYYRPYQKSGNNIQPLLFCYQSTLHGDLLSTYGSCVLMDATYKTTKYSLPLFLLVVRTNVNYCPVGFFVVQNEDTRSITEALNIFKAWNRTTWKPQYFLVDYSEAEINAINSAFSPKPSIKICSFHREQAWLRWVTKSGNLVNKDHKDAILSLWRNIAKSPDQNTLECNLEKLESNEIFQQNAKAVRYFYNTWLTVKELWIVAFFDTDFLININTNNGIESQNKLLKYSFLKAHSDKTLSNILEVIIEDFLTSSINEYEIANSKLSADYRLYNNEIPEFLHNKPAQFVKHVYARYRTAEKVYSRDSVRVKSDEILEVRSETNPNKWYIIDWNKASCNCQDFATYKYPCKHICAVMILVPGYSFQSLPYSENPFFNVNSQFNLLEMEKMILDEDIEEVIVSEPPHPPLNLAENEPLNLDESNQLKKKIAELREETKNIINLSYDINPTCVNLEVVDNILLMLKEIRQNLDKCTKKDNDLIILNKN